MIAYIEQFGHLETILSYMYLFYNINLNLDFYIDITTENDEINSYNNQFCNNAFQIFPFKLFLTKSSQYNTVFVGTTDYISGAVNKKINQILDKVIAVYHTKGYIRDRFKRILVYNPSCIIDSRQKYILPIHNFHEPIFCKPDIDREHINIMLIGQAKYKDINDIKRGLEYLEANNLNIRLHYFNRSEKLDINSLYLVQNIGLTNKELIDYIKNKIHFITIFPKKNGQYHNNTMSGTIPLAFNYNIPLIMDTKMKNIFGFKNVVEYNENSSIVDTFGLITDMSKKQYRELIERFYLEKKEIINKNILTIKQYLIL